MQQEEKTRYFSFDDDEEVRKLGEFDDIEQAFEAADARPHCRSIWVFGEHAMYGLQQSIKEALA